MNAERMRTAAADYLPMAMTALIWGTMGVSGKIAVTALPPLLVLGIRSLIAAVLLGFYLAGRRQPLLPAPSDRAAVLALGVTGVFLNNYFYLIALRLTSLTNCAVLFATSPAMTAVLARIFFGEPLGPKRVAGVVLAFAGVVFLLTDGHPGQLSLSSLNLGDLAELAAAFCASLLALIGRRVRETPPTTTTFNTMLVGSVMAFAFFAAGGEPLPAAPSLRTWAALLHLGILCSCLAYIGQQVSVSRIGATASSAFLNAVPPITILTAFAVLGEEITAVHLLSMLIIFSGVYLNVRDR